MSQKNIIVDRSYFQSIADDYSKIGALVDFVSSELLIMHKFNNGTSETGPTVTIYQLHAMLEALDGRLMDRESLVRGHLGELKE